MTIKPTIIIAAFALLIVSACDKGAPCNSNADCSGAEKCVVENSSGSGAGSGTSTNPPEPTEPDEPPAPPSTTTDPAPTPPSQPGTPTPPTPPPSGMNGLAAGPADDGTPDAPTSYAGVCQAPEGEGSIVSHRCAGSARSCMSLSRSSCNGQQGCYYSSFYGRCAGYPTRCTYLVSKSSCQGQRGCSWVKR